MSHTKEPWHIRTLDKSLGCIDAQDDISVAYTQQIIGDTLTHDTRKANARRIVACVNACAGIPDEVLPSLKANYSACIQHRNELLAALDWIANVNAMDYEYRRVARAAITKVEAAA